MRGEFEDEGAGPAEGGGPGEQVQHVDRPVQEAVVRALPSQWWVTETLVSDVAILGSLLVMVLASYELLIQVLLPLRHPASGIPGSLRVW